MRCAPVLRQFYARKGAVPAVAGVDALHVAHGPACCCGGVRLAPQRSQRSRPLLTGSGAVCGEAIRLDTGPPCVRLGAVTK